MTNNKIIETAKELTFGTELEYTGITREKAAKAIHSVVGGTVQYIGGIYDAWQVTALDGRVWKAVSDGSLTDRATSAEVVTPILKWEDMETLQEVVRALRKAGAKTPSCTSQHVHVGVERFSAFQIANIADLNVRSLKHIENPPSDFSHHEKMIPHFERNCNPEEKREAFIVASLWSSRKHGLNHLIAGVGRITPSL
jgi:hypothetical protein